MRWSQSFLSSLYRFWRGSFFLSRSDLNLLKEQSPLILHQSLWTIDSRLDEWKNGLPEGEKKEITRDPGLIKKSPVIHARKSFSFFIPAPTLLLSSLLLPSSPSSLISFFVVFHVVFGPKLRTLFFVWCLMFRGKKVRDRASFEGSLTSSTGIYSSFFASLRRHASE